LSGFSNGQSSCPLALAEGCAAEQAAGPGRGRILFFNGILVFRRPRQVSFIVSYWRPELERYPGTVVLAAVIAFAGCQKPEGPVGGQAGVESKPTAAGAEPVAVKERMAGMSLVWKSSKPAPDPFEAVVGDRTEYQVHFAESTAADTADVEAAILDVVKKAFGFSEANKGERGKRIVFLWDVVYATLTVVYTDESMMHDARHVTKCYFVELDESGSAKALSREVRRMIEAALAPSRLGFVPPTIPVFYSDQDRASVGEADFMAQKLTNG